MLQNGTHAAGATPETDDLLQSLQVIAPQMNVLRRRWLARLHYDAIADALWWSDERPKLTHLRDHWCLRLLFRYRTSLILGEPDLNCEPAWLEATRSFPNWPGFHPSRCQPNKRLVAFYAKCRDETARQIEWLPDQSIGR
jgi:hypothetical protein